jgi:hypothetical protein
MRNADLELEDELEDLARTLSESDLESESGWEGDAPRYVPPGRCTPVGTRVGSFVYSPLDFARIVSFLGVTVSPATLRSAVEAAAAWGVSLASTAALLLDAPNRTGVTRVAFCAAFGVPPTFVPPWRKAGDSWQDLGDLIAIRLRKVAKLLDGGCIQYFALGNSGYCADCKGAFSDPSTYFACSSFHNIYQICLGFPFWRAWKDHDPVTTALILVHEPLHIYYGQAGVHHIPAILDVGKSGNAWCYMNYVARVNGLPVRPVVAATFCPTNACAPLPQPVIDNFKVDHSELQPFHAAPIKQIAQTVVASWKTISPVLIIELMGFADITGPAAHNFDLGQQRAIAVREAIAKAITDQDPAVLGKVMFIPLSGGAEGPIAPNNTNEGRARNRRVEVSLLPS